MIEVPNIPGSESSGAHKVPLEKTIYIESSDFKEVSKHRSIYDVFPTTLFYANCIAKRLDVVLFTFFGV